MHLETVRNVEHAKVSRRDAALKLVQDALVKLFTTMGDNVGEAAAYLCAAVLTILLRMAKGNIEVAVKDHIAGNQIYVKEFVEIQRR